MDGLELASIVSTDKEYELGDPNAPYKVAVMDYGIKRNILTCLTRSWRVCARASGTYFFRAE